MSTNFFFNLDEFRVRRAETRRTLGRMTARAVRIGLEDGANRARTQHKHRKQTGYLTRPDVLYGKVIVSNDDQTWGYLENEADYAGYVEDGTDPHVIRPIDYWGGSKPRHRSGSDAGKVVKNPTHGAGRGKFLRFRIGGRVIFARFVNHPGTPPLPFMVPASEFAAKRIEEETEGATFNSLLEVWR